MKFLARIMVCSVLFLSILGASHAMGQFFMFESPLVGEKAPDFSLKTAGGQEINLTKFRENQSAMLFFWATWCPHCREQLQELTAGKGKEMQDKGIKILLVDIGETADDVRAYVKRHKIPFEVVVDENSTVAEQYNLVGVPTFFFIDKSGIVRGVEHGIPDNYEELFAEEKKEPK